MARKFLYIVAFFIVLAIAGAVVIVMFPGSVTRFVIDQQVPTIKFEKQEALATNIYEDPNMWFSQGKTPANNPTLWLPEGAQKAEIPGQAAIFFIHPTSFIPKTHWNAPLDDKVSQDRARTFLRGLATPFNAAGDVWAPRYRQASVGAFLTDKPEGQLALDSAYQDIELAFKQFVRSVQKDRPIILAGHSQGSLHLTRLLKEQIAGKPIAKRIVAAYVVGWPVSLETDLPELGLPACDSPDKTGCIMSWESFAEPAEYGPLVEIYNKTTGLNGQSRKDTPILCTNPLNGGASPDATAEANMGTLKPSEDMSTGELIAKTVPARCNEQGLLLIGDPIEMGPYVIPGNNYHVYDYPLFWANVRADALWRLQKFLTKK